MKDLTGLTPTRYVDVSYKTENDCTREQVRPRNRPEPGIRPFRRREETTRRDLDRLGGLGPVSTPGRTHVGRPRFGKVFSGSTTTVPPPCRPGVFGTTETVTVFGP